MSLLKIRFKGNQRAISCEQLPFYVLANLNHREMEQPQDQFITYIHTHIHMGFPGGSDGKRIRLLCRRSRFNPWAGKIPWRRE